MTSALILDLIELVKKFWWEILIINVSFYYLFQILKKLTLEFVLNMLKNSLVSTSKKELRNSLIFQVILSVLIVFKFTFDSTSIGILLTIAAIFCGLLFNLLLLVYDLFHKICFKISERKINGSMITQEIVDTREGLEYLYKSIALLIFESLIMIVISIPFLFKLTNVISSCFLSFILIYILISFVKNLFFTLRNVFELIMYLLE